MTNEKLAETIDKFLPFWEKEEENCYETTLEMLNNNNTKELQDAYNYFVDLYGADVILDELASRIANNKLAERKRELIRQANLVVNFIDEHNNKFETLELTDFLQDNEIEYMYFESIKELFSYYTEEKYNTLMFNKVIFMKSGEIIILQAF